MQLLMSHIARAKEQPHGVRRQLAFVLAVVGAGLVALVWGVVALSTNAFAIVEQHSFATAANTTNNTGLAAVGASVAPSTQPRIEIVDAKPRAQGTKSEQTFIPF